MMKINRINFFFNSFLFLYIVGGIAAVLLSHIKHLNKEHFGFAFFMGAILVQFVLQANINNSIIQTNTQKLGYYLISTIKIRSIIFLNLLSILLVIFLKSRPNYHLSFEYFLLVSSISAFIVLQILINNSLSKINIYFILLEILALSLFVSLSFLYIIPGPYGNDASYHIEYIKSILEFGSIEQYTGQYLNYPLFHISFVVFEQLTKIENLKTLQAFMIITQILVFILMFSFICKIFNEEVALISVFFFSMTPDLLQSRYAYMPGNFSAIFFIIFLYLLLARGLKQSNLSSILIFIFITANFFHPFTPAVLIFFYFLLLSISKTLNLGKSMFSAKYILFMIVLTFACWMRNIGQQGDLFSSFLKSIIDALNVSESSVSNIDQVTLSGIYTYSDILLNDLGYTTLIFLGIVGSFCVMKEISLKNSKELTRKDEKRFLLSIVTLIFIPFPFVLALIYPESLPSRWFPFIEILTSIFAGVIIFTISQGNGIKKTYASLIILAVISTCVIFFMISSPYVNPNSNLYAESLSGRAGLLESEITAGDFINSLQLKKIHANYIYIQFINRTLMNLSDAINPNDFRTYRDGFVVIRNYDMRKGFIIPLFGHGKLMEIINPNISLYDVLYNSSKIYENREVRLYNDFPNS